MGHGYGLEENAEGVCISLRGKWKNHIIENIVLIQGRAQYVVLEIGGTRWGILNIYAPNQVVNRKLFWLQLHTLFLLQARLEVAVGCPYLVSK